MSEIKSFGPFAQIVTCDKLPATGPVGELEVLENMGIQVRGEVIEKIGPMESLEGEQISFPYPAVAVPGFIDAHTHICFAGSRANDYALRTCGMSYLAIAERGGGILQTVRQTRAASENELIEGVQKRANRLLANGVTTCEVKSGYGLSLAEEVKMLRAIQKASTKTTLIPTCLAAHTLPPEFTSRQEYLQMIIKELLPIVKEERLASRVDIFVEKGAFSAAEALPFLLAAKEMGFEIVVHADQFSRGGALLAAEVGARSADHLEVSIAEDFYKMQEAGVTAVMLPGATLGLGLAFPPAREALDAGLSVVIASDWNPGSAPMGDLLTQAALLGAAQKLSIPETLAAMTVRAAHVLGLHDRGVLKSEKIADIAIFPVANYQEIFYYQGALKPTDVIKAGIL